MQKATKHIHHHIPLCLLLGIVSCTEPHSPVMPKWDAELNVPLIARTYTMEELLKQQGSLQTETGDGGVLVVAQDIPLETITLDDVVKIDGSTSTLTAGIGDIRYDIPDIIRRDVAIGELFPSIREGVYTIAPAVSPVPVSVDVDSRAFFEEATFERGSIAFDITNTLSIPLTFPAGAEMHDQQGRLLGRVDIPGVLAPGQSRYLAPIRLDGITLFGGMRFIASIATPGSGGLPVAVTSTMALRIHAALAETRIRTAVATIPSQHVSVSGAISLFRQSGIRLTEGIIRSGTLTMSAESGIGVGTELRFTLDDARAGGQALRRTMTIPANGIRTMSIDLAGIELHPGNESDLTCSLEITTVSAAGAPVRISSTDGISLTATLSDLALERMTGTVVPRTIDVHQILETRLVSDPRFQGSLTFTEASMWADLRNSSPLEIETGGVTISDVRASAGGGNPILIPASTIAAGGPTHIDFDGAQVLRFLNAFPERLPERIAFDGTLTYNRQARYATARADDSLTGTLHLEIPLKMSIKDATVIDTTELAIGTEQRADLEQVNRGELTFEMSNHLPAGVTLEAEVLDQSHTVLFAPKPEEDGVFRVAPAALDASGRAMTTVKSVSRLRMTASEFSQLARGKYIRFRIAVDPGSPRVTFRTTDFIAIRAYATLEVGSDIVLR